MKLATPLLVIVLALAASLAQAQAPGNPPAPAPAAPGAPALTSGLAPLPGDQAIPAKWLPPGSSDPDRGPSDVVFPTQHVTIRFNHKLHIGKQATTCKTCHAAAYTSDNVNDKLLPSPATCDGCHSTDHSNLAAVKEGIDATGKCGFCHVGYRPEDGNRVAPMAMPRANMRFTHKKHVDRNINCAQCHGAVQELELATRDQLPRMRGCLGCHQHPDAASRGDAKSACETCHVRGNGSEAGRIKTMFASGALKPPRWLHNAEHTPDFIERHKFVAGNDSQFCSNCHTEDYCVACHDGRVRPRSIHPNDYISMHPIEARQAAQKCQSCHREQSFCLTCHQRVGVSMSGPEGARMSGRFHPPKSIWSDPPRKPGHHGFEAERNLNACVSCHTERDCVTCHGGLGIGGGFNPHKNGFAGSCATQYRRNPRPCLVCHEPGAGALAQCR